MKKKMLIVLSFLLVIPALLIFTSCGKQTVKADVETVQDAQADMDAAAADSSASDVDSESLPADQSVQEPTGPSAEEMMAMEKAEAMQSLVNEDVLFDYDSAALTETAQEILKTKADYLGKQCASIPVTIEGHCDDRGTNEYNLALGERRARSAMNYLINLGVAPSRLNIISYGEEKPLDPGQNEDAWSKNRRAHFIIK
ncbi:MAG: peptidoglycan-associated lipoprotein Pal [Proteobacteria bacterium]|nr:peptidoglycan-associated lipoprotein Pal [Pseudomonadota bacterium]